MVENPIDDSEKLSDQPPFNTQTSALLTQEQREYLKGHADIETKSARERSMRSRIRERLTKSIEDGSLLWKRLERRDLEKSFGFPDSFNMSSSFLALVLDGMIRASKYEVEDIQDNDKIIDMLEDILGTAISRIYVNRGSEVESIDVSIDIELGRNVEAITEQNLEEVSIDGLMLLFQSGKISNKEFQSALRDHDEIEFVDTPSSTDDVDPQKDE